MIRGDDFGIGRHLGGLRFRRASLVLTEFHSSTDTTTGTEERGRLRAPNGKRFDAPLNLPNGVGSASSYETVAFWKWFESTAPGMIAAIVADHRARTRILVSSTVDILNAVEAHYLDGLLSLHPAVDFLDSAVAALWRK